MAEAGTGAAGSGAEVFSEWRRQFDLARTPYDARVALGVAFYETSSDLPGGPFQPLDGDLTAFAALTGTNTIYYRSAADTWSPVVMGSKMTFSGGTLNTTAIADAPSDTKTYGRKDAAWVEVGRFTTGDAKITFKTVADAGWILVDDGSIGNASSGSTTRANADTLALFSLLFDNLDDSTAPLFNSDGFTSRARGEFANAAACFGANCRMNIPLHLGTTLAIANPAGFLPLGLHVADIGGGSSIFRTFWNIMIKL